jgi:hypothetical protein
MLWGVLYVYPPKRTYVRCINIIGSGIYVGLTHIFMALPLFAPGGLPYMLDGYTGLASPIKGGGGYLSGIAYLQRHRDS